MDQTCSNRARQVIYINWYTRVRIRKCIAHFQSKSLDQRIFDAETMDEFNVSRVGGGQFCSDFFDNGVTHVEVQGAKFAAKANPEVDASRQNKKPAGRNDTACPAFMEDAAYRDWAVEMQNDKVIGYACIGGLVR
jgi:hypothetical protein